MIGNYVAGEGPPTARVMLVGEGPGRQESIDGRPFCGASGSELDWLYLRRAAKLWREDVYVTNLVKWRTDEKDSDPTAKDIQRDEHILIDEIDAINPEIIVAIGAVAARWFLQTEKVDFDKYHGHPIDCPRYPGRTLLVVYHPAAGLHQPERYSHLVYWDFEQLGKVVRGEIRRNASQPTVQVVEGPSSFGLQAQSLDYISVDTEGSVKLPWGMSWCVEEGKGYVVRKGSIDLAGQWVEGHNLLHDVKVFRSLGQDIDLSRCDDTMLMAYLLPWLPRALKPLMFKLCNLGQATYEETIGDAQEKISETYLRERVLGRTCERCSGEGEVRVSHKRNIDKFKSVKCPSCGGDGTSWPQPDTQLIFDGTYIGKQYKPRSAGRRVREILSSGVELKAKWEAIDESVRAPIEGVIGKLPEATLDDIPLEKAVHYSGMDAVGTRAVGIELRKMLKAEGLERVYEIDKSILPIIDRMHTNGILLDREHFSKLEKQFAGEQLACIDQLSQAAGFTFNPSSPIQVGELLYTKLGLKPPRGKWSTDEKTLETLKIKHKNRPDVTTLVDLITDFRELDKLLGTYVRPLPLAADSWGRVHTRFLLHVTNTGRLVSRDPNLQNQPTRSERGRAIRRGFIPKPGCKLVSVDLDQIELRIAAHISEDPNMVDVFIGAVTCPINLAKGKCSCHDIHTATAALIYNKPREEVTVQERLLAKTINFLILYGGGANKLHKELALLGINVTKDECIQYIDGWFTAYPQVQSYMERMHAQARATNYVEDLFGRRRYVPGVHSTIDRVAEESLRWATNFPIQATAAGVLKIWMSKVWRNVLPVVSSRCYCEVLLTVHDELIFEVEEGYEDLLISLVVQEAAQTVDMLVPISAKGSAAYNWSDLK